MGRRRIATEAHQDRRFVALAAEENLAVIVQVRLGHEVGISGQAVDAKRAIQQPLLARMPMGCGSWSRESLDCFLIPNSLYMLALPSANAELNLNPFSLMRNGAREMGSE